MRGAAKSQAPLPTAWMDNITGTTEVLTKAYPNAIPAIEAFFEFPYSFEDAGHKLAKSTPQKMAKKKVYLEN